MTAETLINDNTAATATNATSGGLQTGELRIAVVGNVDSGKSTIIGVLTSGELDNGRGLARAKVFTHTHERDSGRTSCASQHILGIDSVGQPVHHTGVASSTAAAKTKAWSSVVRASRTVATFIDLCGHERYLKTTIGGLTGLYPDYALVVVNSLAGITRMTKEHVGCCVALAIPLLVIVTKVDLAPANVLDNTRVALDKLLKTQARKLPIHVRDQKDVAVACSSPGGRVTPCFFVSAVTGEGLDLLFAWLASARPRGIWHSQLQQPSEFAIDETFNVTGVGVVVSGMLRAGVLSKETTMLLGPCDDANAPWRPVLVRSIHCKRCPIDNIEAGTSAALGLRALRSKDLLKRQHIRRGMVLIHPSAQPRASRVFEATVLILHHPTLVRLGYQAVCHAGIVRQTASITHMSLECLRTGDRATCRFRFIQRDEYMQVGTVFVFREGSTKGLGTVTKTQQDMSFEDIEQALSFGNSSQKRYKNNRLAIHQPISDPHASTSTETTISVSNGDATTSSPSKSLNGREQWSKR